MTDFFFLSLGALSSLFLTPGLTEGLEVIGVKSVWLEREDRGSSYKGLTCTQLVGYLCG